MKATERGEILREHVIDMNSVDFYYIEALNSILKCGDDDLFAGELNSI